MDELRERDTFCQSIQLSNPNHSSAVDFSHQTLPNMSPPSNQLLHLSSNQRPETELKDSITARKVQKADREKLRRDRLNEQFLELGKTLDQSFFSTHVELSSEIIIIVVKGTRGLLLNDSNLDVCMNNNQFCPFRSLIRHLSLIHYLKLIHYLCLIQIMSPFQEDLHESLFLWIDPDRPKNDKASILSDTILLLKDLTAQVSRLKAEHASLTEESRELTQEKNDLKEEKAAVKSDIENLNAQYQQRLRSVYPWSGVDHPVVMHPSYHFPLPMPIAPGPIPIHPPLQPYPFFGNQNPAAVPNPCSTFVPYVNATTVIEQQSIQFATPGMGTSSRSCTSSKQDSRKKSSGQEERVEKSEYSNDVATNLELKTPGSTPDQDSASKHGKFSKLQRKENSPTDGGSSSRCSYHSVQASSSNCINDGTSFEGQ